MSQEAFDEKVKDTYTTILDNLYNSLDLIGEENEIASSQINNSIDLISNLMYSDPRC